MLAHGFDNCGIIPLEYLDGFRQRYQERIHRVPSSAFIYKVVGELTETKKRFPWAKSIVICTYWFGKYSYPKEMQGRYAKAYFLSPEPHQKNGYDQDGLEQWFEEHGIRCEGGEQFSHLSIGPLRYAAMMAGLGIIRKNNFFYTEKGSYVNLVGYVIDRECSLIHHSKLKPCSESCTLCQKSCRTKALKAPYTMSPLKCVSFWNTFGKGMVPFFLKSEMFEEWICGCDNCQDACPYNLKQNWDEGEKFSDLEEIAPNLLPEQLLKMPNDYLAKHVIPKTANHMHLSDIPVLRRNAKRVLRYRKNEK